MTGRWQAAGTRVRQIWTRLVADMSLRPCSNYRKSLTWRRRTRTSRSRPRSGRHLPDHPRRPADHPPSPVSHRRMSRDVRHVTRCPGAAMTSRCWALPATGDWRRAVDKCTRRQHRQVGVTSTAVQLQLCCCYRCRCHGYRHLHHNSARLTQTTVPATAWRHPPMIFGPREECRNLFPLSYHVGICWGPKSLGAISDGLAPWTEEHDRSPRNTPLRNATVVFFTAWRCLSVSLSATLVYCDQMAKLSSDFILN